MIAEKSVNASNTRRRLDLYNLFFSIEKNLEKKWVKLFSTNFKTIADFFRELSKQKHFDQQEVNSDFILWRTPGSSTVECMFYFINNPSSLSEVYNCFRFIKQYNVGLTYAVVRQSKEGKDIFDIFRLSKYSYLEHCNRLKS